jgi:predicted acylesterase/phospholipase RssA
MTIKHIVMAGGAYNGIYMFGTLKKLIKSNFFNIKEIQTIYGTSVGGLLGVLLCLKEDWDTIINYIIERPWDKDYCFTTDMMFQMIPNKGILDKSFIELFLLKLLKAKNLSENITLKEFYEFSKIELILFAIDANTFDIVKISYKTHADISLIDAIYITCSIPFIFQPLYVNDTYLIDGGTLYNYPLDSCIEDGAKEDEILGINFAVNTKNKTKMDKDTNIFHYGYHIMDKLVGAARKGSKYSIPHQVIIPCNATEIAIALNMIKDKELRKEYIEKGEEYAELFLTYQKD